MASSFDNAMTIQDQMVFLLQRMSAFAVKTDSKQTEGQTHEQDAG